MYAQTINTADALSYNNEMMRDSQIAGIERAILGVLEANEVETVESITLTERVYGMVEIRVAVIVAGESKTVRMFCNSVGHTHSVKGEGEEMKKVSGRKMYTNFM